VRRGPTTLFMRALGAVMAAALLMLGLSACGSGGGDDAYNAEFRRAVQVFPGIKVRVLGVDVGHVTAVANDADGVRVRFQIDDPDTKLAADVKAAVVPVSLLGERYIQLFPAYETGPTLQPGTTIPLSRTAVPAEPDELLRSMQDYLGGLDRDTVTRFVENGAKLLEGNGTSVNRFIHNGTQLLSTLNAKRDDLAQLVVELDKVTTALASRQQAVGQLIRDYDAVSGTLTTNRAALEGTITGLNDAATQLAALLLAHRRPLHTDIERLTRTGQTLVKNVNALAETGHWATRLFLAASRAVDFNHDWLRLGNQGQELAALVLLRLEERLMELCNDSGSPKCTTQSYWSAHVPSLFCFVGTCPVSSLPAPVAVTRALRSQPKTHVALKARARSQHTTVPLMLKALLDGTVGDPYRWMAA
jgi:phospholipid/cholesterol/gamma-HCH transport system substrate-binding protein